MKIGIIDYELGNIRSVEGAVERLGHAAVVSGQIEDLRRTDKLILPGVGAYGDGMSNLRRLGLVEPLTALVMEDMKPILGICLGCQLMARESEEFGHHLGLGWVAGSVRRMQTGAELRLPHVGWNNLFQVRETPLLEGIPEDALFYYVHSYHIGCADETLTVATCEYGVRFTAAFQMNNVFGTQFHPEKSQRHGLTLLDNFIRA